MPTVRRLPRGPVQRLPRADGLSRDAAISAFRPLLVVVSGCSGGKSTLVEALARRGHDVVREPGREIVRAALADGDRGADASVLPWIDPGAFAERCLQRSSEAHERAVETGRPCVFDRSAVDAPTNLAHRDPARWRRHAALAERHRYARRVYMAPPWRALFENDAERRHDFDEAVIEYGRLLAGYREAGYETVELPKVSVAERVAIVERELGRS